MYHPPSKRKQVIQRAIVYSLMSLAVVGLVTVLIFIMLGYQFNRNDGRIEQGGLAQFDSSPTGATVTIDGTNFGTRTPSKTTMSAGSHYITMQRDGYRQWQKSVEVIPGSVLWLNYARLVPKELKVEHTAQLATVSSTSVSPNSRWMAIKENPADPVVRLVDLNGDSPKITPLELPATSYTTPTAGKTSSFSLVRWDHDSRYILTKHTYDDTKAEWLVIDSQNVAATQNITKLLDIDASKVVFSGNDSNILYAQIGHDVRRINRKDETLSRPLVSNVAEFSIYKDSTIVFTSLVDAATKKRSVGYYDSDVDKIRAVASYEDDGTTPLHLAIGKYFNDTYFAIAYGESVQVIKSDFSDPLKKNIINTATLAGGAQYLSIVTEGRFVVAQRGNTYVVHDLELNKTTTTTLKGVSEVKENLKWLDNHMLWSDQDGMLRLYEFDGANQHDIMPVVPGFNVTLTSNERFIYGIGKSADGVYHLDRVRMILQ